MSCSKILNIFNLCIYYSGVGDVLYIAGSKNSGLISQEYRTDKVG